MDVLIIGRAICGIIGSGIYIGVITLFAAMTTINKHSIYISGTGFIWGFGTILSPIIKGGFFDLSINWR